MDDRKQLISFEHVNGNSIRLLEDLCSFRSRFQIEIKGPDTEWFSVAQFDKQYKRKQWKCFYEMLANLDYVKINRRR